MCYCKHMKTLIALLSRAFTLVVLTPFDYLLFGGSGVLSRSREEWREMIQEDLKARPDALIAASKTAGGDPYFELENPFQPGLNWTKSMGSPNVGDPVYGPGARYASSWDDG